MKSEFRLRNICFIAMLLLGSLTLASCLDLSDNSPHDVSIDKEIASPDGKSVATFYIIFGGGAAGYVNTRLQIRPKNQPFKENEKYVFDMSHSDEHQVEWKDNRHLIVVYPSDASILRIWTKQGDIEIAYKAKPPHPLNVMPK